MSEQGSKVATVTGAARGFGQAISIGLAERGFDILAVDLNDPSETVEAVAALGQRAAPLVADVSAPASSELLEQKLRQEFGRCDVLVNNAGILLTKPITEMDFAFWEKILTINLASQFVMVKGVLDLMIERRWGRIVNITSNSLGLPVPNASAYMASKGGVIGFTRGLANDVAEYGITVNAVGPTASLTPGGIENIEREHIEQLAQAQAIKRPGEATDIVGTVCFLAGEDSAWVTAQTIMADGGLVRL